VNNCWNRKNNLSAWWYFRVEPATPIWRTHCIKITWKWFLP